MALLIGGRAVRESYEIAVDVGPRFRSAIDETWLRDVVARVLAAEGVAQAEVGVVITGDAAVRDLNRRFRGEDAATDVLSFDLRQDAGEFVLPPGESTRLGDVVISLPAARRQAKRAGHSVEREVALLLTHGVLHLLGYDHAVESEERLMRSRETALLSSLGVL
jgi:probable rRNA maturation factor